MCTNDESSYKHQMSYIFTLCIISYLCYSVYSVLSRWYSASLKILCTDLPMQAAIGFQSSNEIYSIADVRGRSARLTDLLPVQHLQYYDDENTQEEMKG